MAIIATEFPLPRERAKAMSVYMLVVSCGGSLGLLAGGVITQSIDWHWIFFINVPVGVATFLFGRALISENQGLGIGRDVDIAGPVLVTAAMMLGVYAIVTSSSHGWGSTHTLGLGAVAVLLLAGFVTLEARLHNPIMPLRIFRVRGLAASSLIRGLLITGMYASFFIGVLYLQHVLRYGTLQTGLAFLPQTLCVAALSFGATAALVNRLGPRTPLLVGLATSAAGMALLLRLGSGAGVRADRTPRCSSRAQSRSRCSAPWRPSARARWPPAGNRSRARWWAGITWRSWSPWRAPGWPCWPCWPR